MDMDLSAFPSASYLRGHLHVTIPRGQGGREEGMVRFGGTVTAATRVAVRDLLHRILMAHNAGRDEAVREGFTPRHVLRLLDLKGYTIEEWARGVRVGWRNPPVCPTRTSCGAGVRRPDNAGTSSSHAHSLPPPPGGYY